MSDQNQDTRHPATVTRLQQAQCEGDWPKSHELIATSQLLLGVGAMWFLIHTLGSNVIDLSMETWTKRDLAAMQSSSAFENQLCGWLYRISIPLAPILGVLFLIAVFSHVMQSGTATLAGKSPLRLENLNPVSGLQRLFSVRNLTRGIIGVPKIAVLLLVALSLLWSFRFQLADLQQQPTDAIVSRLIQILFTVLMCSAATLFVISLFDYLIERVSFFRRLRMSDQQLRDESNMQGPGPGVAMRRQQLYRDF